MPKNYHLEIREVFDKKYLKVFIKDLDQLKNIQVLITQLPSVKKVNITSSDSTSSPPQNLTVYPKIVYDEQELKTEVEAAIEGYFSGGIYDPEFINETIPALGDAAYFKILDYIIQVGNNLEKYPRATENLDEEGLRDYFLAFLNTVSKNYSATGEAFNKSGRTDILIQDTDGVNIFIAECKIWHGASKLNEAIDQLLERYVNWRDEKVALVVFNKDVTDFSSVIESAQKAVINHKNCIDLIEIRKQTSISYLFKHSDDPSKAIKLELLLFNFRS
ncbi:MAG: hypothetical protein WD028_12990 [Balneolaceae bacterium]